ncbi:MAG TPA: DUF4214 domain-containing protein, partial [Pirellulales bacterium]|nr:DUF4214 domain-containing protein [Pirellulales bacterium]
EIAWGDGVTTTGTVTTTAGGGLLVNGSHAYAEEGTKTVTVTVSDQGGATATATTTATVGDAALAATAASITTTEGATFSGTVATFTDANPGALLGDYTANIVWGDGATTSGTLGATQAGILVNGNHSYVEEGAQTVTVTISDAGGAKATATTTATIADATLHATGTTITTTEGATFSGTIATLIDANSGAPLTDYTVQIAWGDGATSTGTVTTSAGGGLVVSGSHSYVEEGTQTIHAAITDDGNASATATTTATISDATLNATSTIITTTEGAGFSGIVARFSDGNPNAPLGDYTAQIVWGDGATTSGTIATTGGGLVVNGSHSYADEGTQTIHVTITDKGSASAMATSTAVVSDATLQSTGTTIVATAGASFSGTVATFTDANPAAALGDFTAQIDWGDGATTTATVAATAGGGFAVSGEHTYTSNGNLPLVVMIHDTGGSQATATGTAQVTGSTTETLSGVGLAVSGFELSPLVNVPVATFTASNAQEPASAFTVTIHWGDGSSSPGTATLSGSQYTITGSHAYGDEGSFTAKIDVADSLTSTNIVTTAKIAEELLADGTAGTADQRFISEIFRDALGRQAEPQGRDFWASHLQGGDSRTKVVQDILSDKTEEYHSALIQAEFQRYLHRAAEPKAVHDFSALLDAGADAAIVDTIIASSPEYFALHGGSNGAFLDALFADALHRAVDPGSRPFYDDLLAKGANRAVVADIVFASNEYHRDLVEGWFENYLDRAADPTGLANFTAQLDAGTPDEHVVALLLASDEFLAKTS